MNFTVDGCLYPIGDGNIHRANSGCKEPNLSEQEGCNQCSEGVAHKSDSGFCNIGQISVDNVSDFSGE